MSDFKLPDIGEGINTVTVTDILVSKNQHVKNNDIIIVVESEKASMEIPIDRDCVIKQVLVNEVAAFYSKATELNLNGKSMQ